MIKKNKQIILGLVLIVLPFTIYFFTMPKKAYEPFTISHVLLTMIRGTALPLALVGVVISISFLVQNVQKKDLFWWLAFIFISSIIIYLIISLCSVLSLITGMG